jgi:cell pole-organizing protein PopZ
MLAEWLDTNLPGMVEKMVQAEIARIAGKRR